MQLLEYRMYAAMDMGGRPEQQDAVNSSLPELQKDLGVLCVLSDGMGGMTAGARASLAVVQTMVTTFHRSPITDTPEQILLRGCCFAQQEILRLRQETGETGATVAAVLVRDDRCSFLSVGDSRIYLCRGHTLIQLTRDQNRRSRVEKQIGLGRLPEESLTEHGLEALSAYIGMEDLNQVDRSSRSFAVCPGDRILLVSDGVYDTLTEAEMAEALMFPGEQASISMIMHVMAKQLPGQDNCSAVVLDCLAAGY